MKNIKKPLRQRIEDIFDKYEEIYTDPDQYRDFCYHVTPGNYSRIIDEIMSEVSSK